MSHHQTVTNFTKFHESWFDRFHQLVHHLRTSLGTTAAAAAATDDNEQNRLVDKIMAHLTEYYRVKSAAAERDVLGVLAAPWASALERSLHWIGGWRPTTVFHLVYTESSILFESRIIDILRGMRTGDLGDLSPAQFRTVSELQCETVREENAVTNQLSEWQDEASELIMASSADLDEKIGRLVSIVHRADNLRLRTIARVVELLTPQQAAEFLTAAAELRFGVRSWGVSHDQERGRASDV